MKIFKLLLLVLPLFCSDTICLGQTATLKGYSGANEKGIIAAQNDVGIIEFEDGRRVAYAIFLTDSSIGVDAGYEIIAQIGKAIWKTYRN